LKFAFDPRKPKGDRIDSRLVMVGDAPLDLTKVTSFYFYSTLYFLEQIKKKV